MLFPPPPVFPYAIAGGRRAGTAARRTEPSDLPPS